MDKITQIHMEDLIRVIPDLKAECEQLRVLLNRFDKKVRGNIDLSYKLGDELVTLMELVFL